MLAAAGLTTIQARGLIAKVQQAAAQTALALAPAILEEVRKVQEARLLEVIQRTRLLPNTMGLGYISRDRVIQIIQDVFQDPTDVAVWWAFVLSLKNKNVETRSCNSA